MVALLGTALPVLADGPPGSQENPQVALETFSGIALLGYYSSSLDYIIQLDQNGSDTNLGKMPFANVPQELDDATGGFASNGTVFTASIVNLFGLWDQQNTDIQQYRLNDAEALYTQIIDGLPAARQQLSQIESSAVNTGIYLNIASLPSTSGLTQEYNVVMTKIQELFAMLDLLSRPLLPAQFVELLTSTGQPVILTAAQAAAITAGQPVTLTAGQAAAITTGQPGILTATQQAAISTGQPVTLTAGQTTAITAGQTVILTTAQTAAISAGQPVTLTAGQAAAISTGQPGILTAAQQAAITAGQPVTLTTVQIAALVAGQQGTLTPGQIAALLTPTELTLNINPSTAYVGDEVTFSGTLSSQGLPLPGREITLLLNNSDLLTAQTDAQGQFQGKFQLPYQYINQMSVQAIYYPQGDDAGVYLAAVSPVVNITVLFYTAQLTLQLNNTAYPGKEAMITGTFDYGSDPVLQQRAAELYLDNNIEVQFNAGPAFTKGIMLDAQITPGNHLITVSAPADGRYAPVMASYVMDVTLAATILDLHLPVIGFVPGHIQLSGKAYSSLGPLDNAVIVISEGNTSKQITTAADGTFSTNLGMGMGLSLLGTQTITVKVQPQEPWNAPVTRARNIFLIYFINIGLLLAVLVFLGVYLPRRFKKWFAGRPGKKVKLPGMVLPIPPPVYSAKDDISLKAKDNKEKEEEAANPVLYWYRIALKFVQDLTKKILKPHQTLREYGREVSRVLGPAGKYFLELTYLLEKRLYGKHQPEASDNQQSRQLAAEIQKQAGSEK